jgi:hypothetical protein
MSDFPHVLENLLDSEQAAAIVKVPEDSSTIRT